MKLLLMPFHKNGFSLKNHIVMSPMTRSRAINNLPNKLMAEYYSQRSGAGLIIAEGTAPAPEALGYPRIPGIFSQAQIEGWKQVTTAVHAGNSKFFLQLMHTGRIGHKDNLPGSVDIVGPSAIKAAGQIFTDTKGLQEYSEPVALTGDGLKAVIKEFAAAAKNAIEAGFDGVEIHGANGYLPEQFLNPNINDRKDEYGGTIENRSRFTIEIIEEVASAIGKEKVGIRLSPFSTLSDLAPYPEDDVHETYSYLANKLSSLDILYIHISSNPSIPQRTLSAIRSGFKGILIFSNGLSPDTAEEILQQGKADLVGFGKSFLANPDFVQRIETGAPLNQVNFKTLYSPGSEGYTDYPAL